MTTGSSWHWPRRARSRISIYWARDAGEFKVSSHIVLQYWDGANWSHHHRTEAAG